jgi:hypothetical protein
MAPTPLPSYLFFSAGTSSAGTTLYSSSLAVGSQGTPLTVAGDHMGMIEGVAYGLYEGERKVRTPAPARSQLIKARVWPHI